MMEQEIINSEKQNNSESTKMLKAMVGIGVLCAFLIVLTYQNTLSRIETLKQESLQKAIFKVLPDAKTSKAFLYVNGQFIEESEKTSNAPKLFAGYGENQRLVGFAIPARGQGYADIISILYGYDQSEQNISGMHVLESKETPGLGDKIEKDDSFKSNFESLSAELNEEKSGLVNEIITVKNGAKEDPWQIDGITGATISSRAIGKMINESANEWIPRIQNSLDQFETNGK